METNQENPIKKRSIINLLKSRQFLRPLIGISIGALAGLLYYHFIGCNSGSCPITGSPYGSIITGGLFGFLITGSSGSGRS